MNFIHLISNKVWGGGERYAFDLCNTLRADGHNVEVYCRRYPEVRDFFAKEGLLKGIMSFRGIGGLLSPVKLASELNKLEGKTIIHVHNFKDAVIALNARRLAAKPMAVKVIATRHLVKPARTTASHRRIYNELDAIIFVSELAKNVFLSSNPAVDTKRLHVIHNSVTMSPYDGKKPDSHPIHIIYTGRIAPEKGLDVLINALAKLKGHDWTLTVCGSGQGRVVMPIVRAARSLGINDRIDWKGHVDTIAPMLCSAHIAVMPSVGIESFGLAAIEAMSQSCAVITTDNGAQSEFIKNGETGLLVPPDDKDALSDALEKLITDHRLRSAIAQNGLNYFRDNLSYKHFYDKILQVFNSI